MFRPTWPTPGRSERRDERRRQRDLGGLAARGCGRGCRRPGRAPRPRRSRRTRAARRHPRPVHAAERGERARQVGELRREEVDGEGQARRGEQRAGLEPLDLLEVGLLDAGDAADLVDEVGARRRRTLSAARVAADSAEGTRRGSAATTASSGSTSARGRDRALWADPRRGTGEQLGDVPREDPVVRAGQGAVEVGDPDLAVVVEEQTPEVEVTVRDPAPRSSATWRHAPRSTSSETSSRSASRVPATWSTARIDSPCGACVTDRTAGTCTPRDAASRPLMASTAAACAGVGRRVVAHVAPAQPAVGLVEASGAPVVLVEHLDVDAARGRVRLVGPRLA